MREVLTIYIAGCALSIAVMALRVSISWCLRWISKTNILLRNLRKLNPPDDRTFGSRIGESVVMTLLSAALSWISALFEIWQTVYIVFDALRELLAATPERVRVLRFPLKTNPDLQREAVWAYVAGLQVLAGELVGAASILAGLESVAKIHPIFDRELALRQLDSLHVVDSATISETRARLPDSTDSASKRSNSRAPQSSPQIAALSTVTANWLREVLLDNEEVVTLSVKSAPERYVQATIVASTLRIESVGEIFLAEELLTTSERAELRRLGWTVESHGNYYCEFPAVLTSLSAATAMLTETLQHVHHVVSADELYVTTAGDGTL